VKRAVVALGVLLLVGGHADPACACTSFAAYSDGTYYGMNFDYDPDVPMRLFVDTRGDLKVFHLAFVRDRHAVRTAGMNSRGLFASDQELYPVQAGKRPLDPGEMYMWQIYELALSECGSVDEVLERVSSKRIVQDPNVTLHVLLADTNGSAAVIETGEEGNVITPIDGDFIVMTNFPNCNYAGGPHDEIEGVGADRYRAAHAHLSKGLSSLDIESAFRLLEKASWEWTRSSMVFDPEQALVYVALERDFERILRVSLADRVIETYAGYDEPIKWTLGSRGIATSELQKPGAGLLARLRHILGIGRR
jgi:hypothetical protein